MKKHNLFVAIAILFGFGPAASAQDHLEPEEGLLAGDDEDWDYMMRLRTKLLSGAAYYHEARMICLPSFEPEWVITVAEEDKEVTAPDGKITYISSYFVEYVGAEKSLWDQEEKWREVAVKKARANLDRETVEAVGEVWSLMLRTVRYPEKERSVLDGVTYHFSSTHDGFKQGQIDTPLENSLTDELAMIGEALRAYAQALPEERDKLRSEIRAKAARLKAKLDQSRRPK